jgi:hypothetical protein
VMNAGFAKSPQCFPDVVGTRFDEEFSNFRGNAFHVFHGAAAIGHVAVCDTSGRAGDVLNYAAAEGSSYVVAQEGMLCRAIISLAFRDKLIPAPVIVLRTGQALADIREMLTADEQLEKRAA